MMQQTILPKILKIQKPNKKPPLIKKNDKIAFVFSTKDRVNLTLKSLKTLDLPGWEKIDIIWLDGSDTEEGQSLPENYKFKNVNLKDVYYVRGGPDATIQFGLEKLLEMGYNYCGLIESDILFKPTWFKTLVKTFRYAAKDKIITGLATLKNYKSRVLEFCNNYTINWNVCAATAFFTNEAAQIVLDNYPPRFATSTRKIFKFYGELFGVDLQTNPEWNDFLPDRILSPDWTYSMFLYQHGLSSIGTIPNMARELDHEVDKISNTEYVKAEDNKTGLNYPFIQENDLKTIKMSEPIFTFMLKILDKTVDPRKIRRIVWKIKTIKK